MSPAVGAGNHMFLAQPQAGSGLRIAAQQGWAPGHSPAIPIPVVIPPGSGAALSERDRRLAARHEERRRRNSHGPKEGPADKSFQERERERQDFEREAVAGKRSAAVERQRPALEEGALKEKPPALRAAIPLAAGNGGAVGNNLAAALDQKVADKTAREVKYEKKRQQYLAAKRGIAPDEPSVRFQESQYPQGAPAATGHSPAKGAPFLGEVRHDSTKPQSNEQRFLLHEPPPRADNHRTGGLDEPTERRDQAKLRTQDPAGAGAQQSPGQRRPLDQDTLLHQQTPTTIVTKYPDADYAMQLQEQITAGLAAAQGVRDIEGHPSAPSNTALPANGQSILHAREAAARSTEAETSSATNRKAEYARQLREQMAADQAMRHALESERKGAASASSGGAVPAGGSGDEQRARGRGVGAHAGGPTGNSKTEYAQQLREQMKAKENAQRAAKRRGGHSPSSRAGPSWIEGATEGREARRRQSNAEYAEQLRAQIAAQKSINQAEQSRIASRLEPEKDWCRQARHEYQQEQQQLPGGVNLQEERRRSEGQLLWSGGQPSSEVAPRQRRMEGERKPPLSQGEAHNALALERQKRVDHQREYAEALRRDMATPKVDSLGRPIEDITSPSRTRIRQRKENNQIGYTLPDRGGGSNALHENRHLQPGPRRQAGGDTREWSQPEWGQQYSHHQPPRHPQQQQGLDREYRWEQISQNRGWPAPQDEHLGWYGRGEQQHNQRRETHYTAAGGVPNGQHVGGGYNHQRPPFEGGAGTGWVGDERGTSGLPPAQGHHPNSTTQRSWESGRGRGEERRERWNSGGPTADGAKSVTMQDGRSMNGGSVADGAWREDDGGDHTRISHPDQRWEHGGQQEYRYSRQGVPPGGAPVVGGGVVSTKASTMHNPVDPEELARIKAKKDSYRRDLETQMAEHKKLVDLRKRGAPGSKEAEVFHLQEAMEERNERNKMAPGYEMGPLGVAVLKDNYSTTGRGKRSPPRTRAPPPPAPATSRPSVTWEEETSSSAGGPPVSSAKSGLFGSGVEKAPPSLLPQTEGGAGGAEGVRVPSRRGVGLRDLLGTETNAERDRERSRVQAEALKKQVEDNKARRDIERAQLELDEKKEELRLQKEREQLHKRYEQEGKLAKALESEKLLKEAEEARLAHAARKEREAAESREKEKLEDARVEREQKELEKKYARERAAEEPLGQDSSGPAKPVVPEFPVRKTAGANSPPRKKTPREVPLVEVQTAPVHLTPAKGAAPSTSPPGNPVKRGNACQPLGSPGERCAPLEAVSIEKLRKELWKQKQLTEVLRHEVGQQETEKRKLLGIARCAKESEAAALRAAYAGRASQQALAKDLGNEGSVVPGNELWRVPPPPIFEDVESGGGASSPRALRWAESADAATEHHDGDRVYDDRLDSEGTTEDRLLLAGLRSLSIRDRTPGEGRGPDSSRQDYLGGHSTFRDRVPGARAWSSGVASNSGDRDGNRGPRPRYDPVSPGGIRAESRYVFPDGSVRRVVETPDADDEGPIGDGGGVPMPLVGSSRVASADLALAQGISALGGGSDRGGGNGTSESRRTGRRGGRSSNGGAYRGPGAAPGAGWAPGGRPPRAYVPFLNLPASNGKADRADSRWRQRKQGHGLGEGSGSINGSSKDGNGSPSLLPSVYPLAGRDRGRRRPLAGVGGVPISPGRAMLTGPGRPGTGESSSSRTTSGLTKSERGHGRPGRRRRRFGGGGSNPANDEELSDGGDSVGSGSTDVEFLRRRAEAKLRALDRQEAKDVLLASSSARSSGAAAAGALKRQPRAVGDDSGAAPTPTKAKHTFSTASSSNRSLLSGRKKRPGTNQSETSMLGDSRWAVLQPT